jgi:hypothetical protein
MVGSFLGVVGLEKPWIVPRLGFDERHESGDLGFQLEQA